jgi:hypothetical protein
VASLKYEKVYLHDYTRMPEAHSGIGNWFRLQSPTVPSKFVWAIAPSSHRQVCNFEAQLGT